MRLSDPSRFLKLPEDAVHAQTSAFRFRIEEGVDGRQTRAHLVRDRYGDQPVFGSELDEPRFAPVAQQEGSKLLRARRMHVSIGMARFDVSRVQGIVFISQARLGDTYRQILIALPDTLLAPPRTEVRDGNPDRDASIAVGAMWSIDVTAAAPESESRERRVERVVDFGGRVDEQSGRLQSLEVAAVVWRGGEELELCEICHERRSGEALKRA